MQTERQNKKKRYLQRNNTLCVEKKSAEKKIGVANYQVEKLRTHDENSSAKYS